MGRPPRRLRLLVGARTAKSLREVWRNKARSVLVILSVAVGSAATGTLLGAREVILGNLTTGFQAIDPSSAIVISEPFGTETLRAIALQPGVGRVEGRSSILARINVGGDRWSQLLLQALPDYTTGRIDHVEPQAGAWPPGRGQLLLERESLTYLHRSLGQRLVVEMPSGRRYSLPLAGTVHDLNRFPVLLTGIPLAYVSQPMFDAMAERPPGEVNEVHLVVDSHADDSQYIKGVVRRVRDSLEQRGSHVIFTRIPPAGEHYLYSATDTLLMLLAVLGVVTLIMGALLVINTISSLLTEQLQQIGVMKSLGARNGQLLALYLRTVLVFGLVAAAIAIPLSSWAAERLIRYVVGIVNFDVATVALPGHIIALEIVCAVLVPLAAALAPVALGCRISVRQALAASSLGFETGRGLALRLLRRPRGLPGPLALSLRNTFRRRARLLLTLSGLVLGGVFFISVLTVRDSLQAVTDTEFHYMRYDAEASFVDLQPAAEVARIASALPGSQYVESWLTQTAYRIEGTAESRAISVIGPPIPTPLMDPILMQGRWLEPSDSNAIVLGSNFAHSNDDLGLGSSVVLNIQGKASSWRVVGVVKTRFLGLGTDDGPTVCVRREALARAMGSVGLASTVKVVTRDHSATAEASYASRLYSELNRRGSATLFVNTIAAIRDQREAPNELVLRFLVAMAALLAVVGGMGLAGMVTMSVMERTREVGVMRALGGSRRAIVGVVMAEGLVIVLLSWLATIPLSVPVSYELAAITTDELFGEPVNFSFAGGAVGLWGGVALLLAVLATSLPAVRAIRVTVRAALAYE